jgi:hypothetical protein
MDISIRKITNGYILQIGSKQTFYDIPEAICGGMAEWVLETCKNLDAKKDDGGDVAAYKNLLKEWKS